MTRLRTPSPKSTLPDDPISGGMENAFTPIRRVCLVLALQNLWHSVVELGLHLSEAGTTVVSCDREAGNVIKEQESTEASA